MHMARTDCSLEVNIIINNSNYNNFKNYFFSLQAILYYIHYI